MTRQQQRLIEDHLLDVSSYSERIQSKKWIYLERNTIQDSVSHYRRQRAAKNMELSAFVEVGNFIG